MVVRTTSVIIQYWKAGVEDKKFEFDGSAWGFIGIVIGMALGTQLSLGLAFPWLWCWQANWYAEHGTIEGRRLKFTGSGMGFLGQYLLIA